MSPAKATPAKITLHDLELTIVTIMEQDCIPIVDWNDLRKMMLSNHKFLPSFW